MRLHLSARALLVGGAIACCFLGGCVAASLATSAVKTTAWAATTAVKGTYKGTRAVVGAVAGRGEEPADISDP